MPIAQYYLVATDIASLVSSTNGISSRWLVAAESMTIPVLHQVIAVDVDDQQQQEMGERDSSNGASPFDALIYFFYGVIICVGVVMNVYVLYRMKRFRRRDREQNKFLLVVLLCMMAVADLLALSSLLVHFVISASSPGLSAGMCKLIMFTTHFSYTQSMWCYLFMSSLRYIATTRPLQYTTLWRIPCAAMIIICVGAVLENVWLLLSVESLDVIGRQGCTQPFNSLNRVHRVLDIFISFVLPILLVLYMDCAVLFRRTKPKTSDPMLQIVINRPNSEKKRVFHRFMVVTVSSLVLNLPENFLRFLAALGLFDKHNGPNSSMIVQLSQAMFFAQAPDVSWNGPFKAHLRSSYDRWMANDSQKEFTSGNPKAPSIDVYLKWIVDA